MPEHDIFDVGRLDVDLAQLGVDGDVGRAAGIERLDERSPIIGIGDDLVVVAAVEQHISLGMPDQEEADRNLDLAAGAVLDDRLVEVERARAEDIELHLFRGLRRHRPGGRQKQSHRQRTKESRTTQQHVVLPVYLLAHCSDISDVSIPQNCGGCAGPGTAAP